MENLQVTLDCGQSDFLSNTQFTVQYIIFEEHMKITGSRKGTG